MPTTMKLIAKNVLGSDTASVTFSSIPGTGYTDLLVVASQRNSVANAGLAVRFNSDTGANYTYRVLYGTGASASSFTQAIAAGYNAYLFTYTTPNVATANTFGATHIYIPNYAGSTNKSCSIESTGESNDATSYISATAGLWSNTAAITSITLLSDPGGAASSHKSGSSFFLYGITKA
jgi:hypothetical protein